MSDQPRSTEILNPVAVEEAIRDAVDEVAQGVIIVSQRLAAYREAESQYDLAYAVAYMGSEGPSHEKKYVAEIQTHEKRRERDAAEVAWRYADRKCRAAESRLSAWQTLSKSVMAMYQAAGRGEY